MSEKETSLKRQKRINFIVNIILGITITLITIAILYRRLEARFFGTVRRHEYQRHEDHSRYAEVYERGRARFATVY